MKKGTPTKRWYQRAVEIAERNGIKRRDLVVSISSITGFEETSVYSWLNGNREPGLEIIRKIAREALKVSVGELIEDDPYYLTDDKERELIDQFRNMDPEERQLWASLITRKKNTPPQES